MRSAKSRDPELRKRPRLSALDRSILALAIPALGSLAADPLYSLLDTAFVGHLGTTELAAVAIGTAAFTASFWMFSFLAYGITPRVAGAIGAGDDESAARVGTHSVAIAFVLGIALTIIGVALAEPIVRALGADGEVAALATPYLRIRSLAAIPVLLITVGHGWLRGAQDTRTPMFIVIIAAAGNAVLDYVFMFVFDWGVAGAAWSTVIGQVGAAVAFVIVLRRRMAKVSWNIERAMIRSLLKVGLELVIRSGSIVGALTVATAVAARMGVVDLGAWQVTMEVFAFLALTLDSIAIAAQALVGKHLGAGEFERATELSRRLMRWGIGLGIAIGAALFVTRDPVAGLFSTDPRVVEAAAGLLGWLALVQPLNAAAFTLDGILIGATDTRFLAAAMAVAAAVFVAISIASLPLEWGTAGLAAGATAWMGVRTVLLTIRLRNERWMA